MCPSNFPATSRHSSALNGWDEEKFVFPANSDKKIKAEQQCIGETLNGIRIFSYYPCEFLEKNSSGRKENQLTSSPCLLPLHRLYKKYERRQSVTWIQVEWSLQEFRYVILIFLLDALPPDSSIWWQIRTFIPFSTESRHFASFLTRCVCIFKGGNRKCSHNKILKWLELKY